MEKTKLFLVAPHGLDQVKYEEVIAKLFCEFKSLNWILSEVLPCYVEWRGLDDHLPKKYNYDSLLHL